VIWQIVKAEQLPFGKRILRRGCRGEDVKELQERLAAAGFYYGVPDGCYGILTEEAVGLLQQAYRLHRDGLAGPAVVAALAENSVKTGRIIYTVKPGDNITQISNRFGVLPPAWRRIPGNRPGVRLVYPGQRLLLYQKVFFLWEQAVAKPQRRVAVPVTGSIVCATAADEQGTSDAETLSPEGGERYYLCDLAPANNIKGELSLEACLQLVRRLPKGSNIKIGWDLRAEPGNTLFWRDGWLKKCLRVLGWKQIPLVVLTLPITSRGIRPPFWTQLDWIGRYAGLIMIEPDWEESTADNLQAAVRHWEKVLPQFARVGRRHALVLALSTHAWNWDEDLGVRRVAFSEVHRLRALYNQGSVITLPGRWELLRYLSQGRRQTLLYRERQWWEDLLQQVIKYNFTGLAIQDFGALGEAGPEIIAATFRVLQES
jgi:peptidoglycan hydrolase-like protein with peptidoglycan-binding domain